MNKKLRLSVVALLLLTGCQTLPNRDADSTDGKQTNTTAQNARSATDRSVTDTQSLWQRATQQMNMEIPERKEIAYFRDWYLTHPKTLNSVIQRATPYLPIVMDELDKRQMPMEFVLLPIVESSYNPNARSPSNAVGIWQFTPDTARRYNLQVNSWYDGRRDIQASTSAALDYLSTLHDNFDGNWFHAIAAYNAGEGRLQQAVSQSLERGKDADFWSLSLPRQTTEYVPRLLALTEIIKNADRYGITLPDTPNKNDWHSIDTSGSVSLSVVADMSGQSVSELKAMNPGYVRGVTPPNGPHRLLVPKKGAHELELALAELPSNRRLQPGQQFVLPEEQERVAKADSDSSRTARMVDYRVKRGDTLKSISKAQGVTEKQLISWNNLHKSNLKPGQTLKLQASLMKKPMNHNYQVRSGDSLYSIAQQFQTTVDELKRLNGLNSHHSLKPGQNLIVKG